MRGKAKASNCWEHWKCSEHEKEACAAYQMQAGRRCCYFTDTFKPLGKRRFSECFSCAWFKKLNPPDRTS